MSRLIGRIASRVMPRTYKNLQVLGSIDLHDDSMVQRLIAYENEIRELRAELNEVRRDNRRVVELYDLVFERLRDDMPLRAVPLPTEKGDRSGAAAVPSDSQRVANDSVDESGDAPGASRD